MQFTIDIPDQFVANVIPHGQDVGRSLLEAAVAEAYRTDRIGPRQVREILGFESRMQLDEFLHRHDVFGYTVEDLEEDLTVLQRLRSEHGTARR